MAVRILAATVLSAIALVVVVAIRLMPPSLAAAPWQGLYLLATVTGASLLLSALIFHAVERPGIALGQRLAGARPQAA